MTPADLRDRLVARLCALGLASVGDAPFVADAALRVVREAMREAPATIKTATGFGLATTEAQEIYTRMLAASPLREE